MRPAADPIRIITARLLAHAADSLRAGRPADAAASLQQAAALVPDDPGIQHDFGLACLESGRLSEAIAALRVAIALNPGFADAHLRLGIALEAVGALEDALLAYRRAWEVQPALADARYRAGQLLDSLGRSAEAGEAFRRAAAAAPQTTLGRIAAARAILCANQYPQAETILRQALALEKGNAAALDLLGNLLADAGRFAEARTVLLQAIERAPLRAGLYYDIVRCDRIGPGDAPLIEAMRAALNRPGLEPIQRARVHLALGKAADDLRDYEQAMRHFDAAAALRTAVAGFDSAAFEARVDRQIATFTPALLGPQTKLGNDDRTPILILGLPRSGTTLVEQILSAHPDIHAGGELAFWNERGRDCDDLLARGSPADTVRSAAKQAGPDYLRLLRTLHPDAPRVTDKMPLNIQWAGLIHAALPRATIIHCHRSPIDTALSIHQTHFNPRMAFPTGGPALVAYIRATRRLAFHWRRVLPAERFIDIGYEELTARPEPVIRQMLAACGLGWNEACLRPEANVRVVKTPSKWQARQPIHGNAVGRWRAYAPWLGALRPLLDEDQALRANEPPEY